MGSIRGTANVVRQTARGPGSCAGRGKCCTLCSCLHPSTDHRGQWDGRCWKRTPTLLGWLQEVLQYVDISHVGMEQSRLDSNVRAAPASPQAATEYSEVKKPCQVGKHKVAAGRNPAWGL